MTKAHLGVLFSIIFTLLLYGVFFIFQFDAYALNMNSYKDTLSDSKPGAYSNHTLDFTLNTDIASGGYLELTPPTGFSILSTTTFDIRNVELYVNSVARTSSSTLNATTDQVIVTTGSPGLIRYNLNTTTGLGNGDDIQLRIGNHTGTAILSVSSTTISDIGLLNSTATGTHRVSLTSGGGTDPAYADFVIAIVEAVGIDGVDTTEQIPPVRFNGAPSGEIGGTTLAIEISLETDEFAICKYGEVADTDYASLPNTFSSTGFIVHRQELTVVNETTYTFYVRCIDDEDNFNTDDYIITFSVPEVPTGDINGDGNDDGDGSGTGGDTSTGGSGSSGSGSGGSSGSSSGGGGSGGGSGGSTGPDSPDTSGGGFESNNAPYESGDARVIINGYAFPRSEIVVLVDGYEAETGKASSDGTFSVTIDAIARGVYTFGIYAVDTDDIKSSTFSTTFSVQGARTSNLSNITIVPSIVVTPDPVNPGETLTLSGYSIPDAIVTIENQKEGLNVSLKSFTATSDGNGAWSLEVDTSKFSNGTYKARAKAEQTSGSISTEFSGYTFYGVGEEADVGINSDLNRDGKVNLTDFSILLFWWGGTGGDSDPPADINGDGRVSLTDFSILLFNWTG